MTEGLQASTDPQTQSPDQLFSTTIAAFQTKIGKARASGKLEIIDTIFGRLWRCTICNKKYASVRGCLSHIESVHENVRLFCPQCGQSTSRKNRLLHHMRHTCRFSKRKLRIAENRRAALKKAAEIRKASEAAKRFTVQPHVAGDLEQTTTSHSQHLNNENDSNNGGNQVCGERSFLSTSSTLRADKSETTAQQQNKKDVATCAICNGTFTTWKSYRHHVKNVHDTKEHVCWKCGTWFPGKDDLRLHVCPLKKVQSEEDSTNGGPSAEQTQKGNVSLIESGNKCTKEINQKPGNFFKIEKSTATPARASANSFSDQYSTSEKYVGASNKGRSYVQTKYKKTENVTSVSLIESGNKCTKEINQKPGNVFKIEKSTATPARASANRFSDQETISEKYVGASNKGRSCFLAKYKKTENVTWQNKKDVATCAICNETFTTWKSYRHHVKNVHDTKEHVCWKCGTWFPGKDDLRLHVCPLKKVQSEADSTNGGPSAEKTQKEKVSLTELGNKCTKESNHTPGKLFTVEKSFGAPARASANNFSDQDTVSEKCVGTRSNGSSYALRFPPVTAKCKKTETVITKKHAEADEVNITRLNPCGDSIVDDHSDRITGQATATRQDTTKTQNKEDFSQENFDSPDDTETPSADLNQPHADSANTEEDLCCRKCDYKASSEKRFQEHISSCLKDSEITEVEKVANRLNLNGETNAAKPYKCSLCEKTFASRDSRKKHKKVVHGRVKTHTCEVCSKTFGQAQDLKVHMHKHTGRKPFECHICCKRFVSSSSRNAHVRQIHEGVKPHQCPVCKKSFGQLWQLKMHKHVLQLSTERFECAVCAAVCKSRTSLRLHYISKHRKASFQCDVCDKMFRSRTALKTHQVSVHAHEMPFKCMDCLRPYKTKRGLSDHRKIYHSTSATKTVCSVCGEMVMVVCMRNHMRTHAREKCKLCSDASRADADDDLDRPQTCPHKEKKWKCEICHRFFSTSGSLTTHMRAHLEQDDNLVCRVCEKRFPSSQLLKRHWITEHLD